MSNAQVVQDGDRYILTQRGQEALRHPGQCVCVYEVQGPYLVCVYCETTYGLTRRTFGGASRDRKGD